MRPRLSWPLIGATLAAIGLQALVLLPLLRPVFLAESLDAHHIALVALCSVTVLVVVEAAKAGDRLLRRGQRRARERQREAREDVLHSAGE